MLLFSAGILAAQVRSYHIPARLNPRHAYPLDGFDHTGLVVNVPGPGQWDSVVVEMTTRDAVQLTTSCEGGINYAAFPLFRASVSQNTGSTVAGSGIPGQRYYKKSWGYDIYKCRSANTSSSKYYQNQIQVADRILPPYRFKHLGRHHFDVIITLELYGEVNLSDVEKVVLPGVTPLTGLDFPDPLPTFVQGADMSGVKMMEDEGIRWSFGDYEMDPFKLLSDFGGNIARFRVWLDPKYAIPEDPSWPGSIPSEFADQAFPYSTIETVVPDILRAKAQGLKVILDFHYSDTWTDPEKNQIPAAWQDAIGDQSALSAELAEYTKFSLDYLSANGALPHYVQIGNEINSNILMSGAYKDMSLSQIANELGVAESKLNGDKTRINWDRNAVLLNAGLESVKNYYPHIQTLLHISGVWKCEWWADQAFDANVDGRLGSAVVNREMVDMMAMSYYPGIGGSEASLSELQSTIERIHTKWDLPVLVVETAYAATTKYSDYVINLMGHYCPDSECQGDVFTCPCKNFPENPTPEGQKDWLLALKSTLLATDGALGFVYWEPFWVGSYHAKSKDFIGSNWENMTFFQYEESQAVDVNPLDLEGGIQVFCDESCPNPPNETATSISNNRDIDSSVNEDLTRSTTLSKRRTGSFEVFPNPARDNINLIMKIVESGPLTITITDLAGRHWYERSLGIRGKGYHQAQIEDANLPAGMYLLELHSPNGRQLKKVLVRK